MRSLISYVRVLRIIRKKFRPERIGSRCTGTAEYCRSSRVLSLPPSLSRHFASKSSSSSSTDQSPISGSNSDYKDKYEKGEFGNYQLVFPSSASPPTRRPVPTEIRKPEYFQNGKPQQVFSIPVLEDSQIVKLRTACSLARLVLNSVIKKAKVGVTTDELDAYAHKLTVEHGAYPSPLNYHGFPNSICTSVNNVACHGIPDDRPLADGDIVNVDVTVYLDGYHGDCSETALVGSVDDKGQQLVKATKDCLHGGISVCGPSVHFREIGRAIQQLASQLGYTVVPAFTGHGIGSQFHTPPDIYHFDYDYDGRMEPGMAFTIEPVLSQGTEFMEILEDGWTAVSVDNSRSAQFEHTVLITDGGVEILTL